MVDSPLVLVSVVSHRQGDLVARLLGDLNRHCPNGYELRIILTLNVPEQLSFGEEDFDFPLKITRNRERRGFGLNHNIAFQSDSCDYFCVLNPDVSLEEDPLPPLLESLRDERVGAVAPFVTDSQGHVEDNARPFPTLRHIFDKVLRKILGLKRSIDQDHTIGEAPVPVDWIAGMFILLSSRTFTEIEGFDPDYFLYYEDVDLCARLRSTGYEVLLDPRSKIVHEARRDSHRSIRHLKLHLASMSRFFFKQISLSLRPRGQSRSRLAKDTHHLRQALYNLPCWGTLGLGGKYMEEMAASSMNLADSSSSTVHVINVLPDDRHGGPSHRVIQVANKLAEQGIKTTLCLPSGEGNAGEIAHEAGISVRRVRCERIPRPTDLGQVIRWGVRLPRDIVRFAKLFNREKPDLVHLSTAYFLPPAIAARLTRVPLLWHLNDIMVAPKIALLLGTLVRVLSDKVVVSAESVASHFGLKAASYEVAYPPVDIGRFKMTSQGGWHGERNARVGFVANWNPVKGVDYFVRAMSEVQAQFEGELEIVMAGARLETQKEYTAHVNELIQDLDLSSAIQDYGFVPSVVPVIESLDVLVMSSTSEAFGMSALEGMAASVPVVVTDVGGVREMVGESEGETAGIIVTPKEPTAIANAVLWLLNSPSDAAQMGSNGLRRAKEKFSLEQSAAKHFELYSQLATKLKQSEGHKPSARN